MNKSVARVSETSPDIDASSGAEQSQYLTFMLQGDMFAIGILSIREILEYGKLTAVPMMPAFIRGVINLRGAVVPVVDLGARFGGQQSEISRRSCIVILEVAAENGSQCIGVLVDSVSAVLEISRTDIEPPPSFGARIRADFIAGMGKIDGEFVIILDVDQVLSVAELAMVGEVAQSQQGGQPAS